MNNNNEIEYISDDSIDEGLLKVIQEIENKNKRKQIRQNRLSVTNLVQIEWCECQHNYINLYGKPKPNKIMEEGSKRHLELELKIHDVLPIEADSYVDREALKLVDCILRIQTLLDKKICRELPIYGFIRKGDSEKIKFIVGVIDVIEKEKVGIKIFETKTRYSLKLPKEGQSRNHKYQLMIYKRMLDKMIEYSKQMMNMNENKGHNNNDVNSEDAKDTFFFDVDSYFKFKNCNQDSVLSKIFINKLIKNDIAKLIFKDTQILETVTLKQLFLIMLSYFAKLPITSNLLTIKYEEQSSNKSIGEIEFQFDSNLTETKIQDTFNYLFKKRSPTGVTDIEEASYKCGNCQFSDICEWREKMANSLIRI
ncbi:hypothetical protein K502DRAFT_325433 [Neoconidiobolus thromboides FSU 785]|nr:hypothetical protein K502DRAFT_325433 [Neoconidiobolus thromboides FSU 785]